MRPVRISSSVLASTVLHVTLVLTVLAIRTQPNVEGIPSVIEVQWVQLDYGVAGAGVDTAPVEAGTPSDAPAEASTASDAPAEVKPAAEAASRARAPAQAGVEAQEPTGDSDSIAIEPDEPPATAGRSDSVTPAPSAERVTEEPAARRVAREPPARLVTEEPARLIEESPAQRVTEEPLEDRLDKDISEQPPVQRVTEKLSVPSVAEELSVPPAQRNMLSERIEEWAEDFAEVEQTEPSVAWEHDGQDYTATFARLPPADDMGIEQVVVTVSTEDNGTRLSTEVRMKRLAFSHFAQLVDRWDPSVQIHDDEIDGRFHSNSEIHIANSRGVHPTFHGKVTTAFRRINTSSSTRRVERDEVFLGGLETSAGRIALPKHFVPFSDFSDDGTVPEHRAHRFEEDTRITFYADGTYGWRSVESPAAEQRRAISDEPSYIIAAEKAELHVSGVVRGKVLVYSPERIIIVDDLIYASRPNRNPDADHYLGLVSDRNIEIAEPDVTGPGDLEIHAAMYAKRRFVVENHRAREDATLFIFGSLTAGSVSATEPRFRTKMEFDQRLENIRPPSFPMTDRYEIAAWDGQWRIARDF